MSTLTCTVPLIVRFKQTGVTPELLRESVDLPLDATEEEAHNKLKRDTRNGLVDTVAEILHDYGFPVEVESPGETTLTVRGDDTEEEGFVITYLQGQDKRREEAA